MKTTPAERARWRAELIRKHPDMCAGDATMALGVLDDLAECQERCAALQAESDATDKWMNETWPTIEDKALGDLVRERDEARAEVAELTSVASAAMTAGLAECEQLRLALEDEWLNRM